MTSAAERPGGPLRLDAELVRRGLARSRGHAHDLVDAGRVLVAGRPATKASQQVDAATAVHLVGDEPVWASRAAAKLGAALDAWEPRGLLVAGRRCLDVGASTGGFTQMLLHHGAAHVVSLDVGHHQLAPSVASDPRVEERSGRSVRGLGAADLGGPGDLVVADLSFISLTLVLADLAGLVAADGDVVVLVKPQFEVGRARLGRRGVVSDPHDRRAALLAVSAAAQDAGLFPYGVLLSPVPGGAGNVEYLMWLRSDGSARMGADALAETVRAITSKGPA